MVCVCDIPPYRAPAHLATKNPEEELTEGALVGGVLGAPLCVVGAGKRNNGLGHFKYGMTMTGSVAYIVKS